MSASEHPSVEGYAARHGQPWPGLHLLEAEGPPVRLCFPVRLAVGGTLLHLGEVSAADVPEVMREVAGRLEEAAAVIREELAAAAREPDSPSAGQAWQEAAQADVAP